MGRHPLDSPLNDQILRCLVGSACYVETALTMGGEWDPTALEYLVYGIDPSDCSGVYRRMYAGMVPFPSKLVITQKNMRGGHVLHWRNHPFWKLLVIGRIGDEAVNNALKGIEGSIERHVYVFPREGNRNLRVSRYEISADAMKSISEFGDFSALLVLTAWAREVRDSNILRMRSQTSIYTRKIFVHAVCNTPHLYIRWPLLAQRYCELFWTAPKSDVSQPWLGGEWGSLESEMETEAKKARMRGVKLPPKRVFDRVNSR